MEAVKKYVGALAIYCGTIIGVGFFGLPYVVSKVGFIPTFFYFAVLGFVTILTALVYAELSYRTKGLHRLPGYAKIYLGSRAKIIATISGIFGSTGSLLAYMLIGGGFLAELLKPVFGGSDYVYIFIYFLAGSVIIFASNKTLALTELIMLAIFFVTCGILFFNALPHIQVKNFFTSDYSYFFLPYGVILFSLSGGSIIPEIKDFLGDKYKHLLKSVLIQGVNISIITYIIFIIAVLGVTGGQTSQDALSGLKNFLPAAIFPIFFIFGILTTFTSYISMGLTLKKIFWYDFKISHLISWLLVCLIPLLSYLSGLNNFIIIISLIGAITLGIDTIMLFLIYKKAKLKETGKIPFKLNLSDKLSFIIILMFFLGIILEILTINKH